MIYWIFTTSLIKENYEKRQTQYMYAISNAIQKLKALDIHEKIKPIIVENTSLTSSCFDTLGVDVVYTENNSIPTTNYGIKEALDVFDVIKKYSIGDDDYIVKMTGRYYLSDTCPFLSSLLEGAYDAIVKYGWWEPSPRTRHADCITGLICMKKKYLDTLDIPNFSDTTTSLESRWARATFSIPEESICMLTTLGIHINPKCYNNDRFFEV